jgi:polyhydroxyalkanoate synthesis regulator phasin
MNSSDLFRQFLDAGMQFTQLTQKRAEAIVKDLVKAGEVQAEQAQSTVTEFVERSRENTDKFFDQVRAEIRQQLKALGVVTKADLAKSQRTGGASQPVAKPQVASPETVKAAAKKATAKKATTKKATTRKSTAKKATAKKATAKKATAKKAPAKKATATKAASASATPLTRTPADNT